MIAAGRTIINTLGTKSARNPACQRPDEVLPPAAAVMILGTGRVYACEFRAAPGLKLLARFCAPKRIGVHMLDRPVAGANRDILPNLRTVRTVGDETGTVFCITVKADQKKAIGADWNWRAIKSYLHRVRRRARNCDRSLHGRTSQPELIARTLRRRRRIERDRLRSFGRTYYYN